MTILLRRVLLVLSVTCSLFFVSLLAVGDARTIEPGKNLKITVTASVSPDPEGTPLRYRWRSTDGQIIDRDAPSTEWTLPAGPGIHFAYLLVSNGKGGYTERRIAVNTDATGSGVVQSPRVNLTAPLAPTSTAVPFRDWLGGGIGSYVFGGEIKRFKVALPDVGVTVTRIGFERARTSLMGDFTLQQFSPAGAEPRPVRGSCLVQGLDVFNCFGRDASLNPIADEVIDVQANQTNRVDPIPTNDIGPTIRWITGSVKLEDGSTCGTENEFFGVTSTATAELVEGGVTVPGSKVKANSWGQFSIAQRLTGGHFRVVVRCEGAAPASPTATPKEISATPPHTAESVDFGVVTIPGGAPKVTNMSVTSEVPGLTAMFIEPPKGLPSDVVPVRPAKFLAMKGLDTRRSGCQYYKAIGAVRDCDAEGNFRGGAISFDEWKRNVKIDQYAEGTPVHKASFINQVDLNLTREHHLVSHPGGTTAGYVCNHPGSNPTDEDPTGLFPPQTEIDRTIDAAISDDGAARNRIACVAMDHSVAPGVNDNKPFTRFLIFGPSGELLPSVNLDGLGEKFVPGACVACHGGNKYSGKFPEDGTGPANIEAHFLPFDISAFAFHSSKPGLTKVDQEEAIFNMNQGVKNTTPNSATRELIDGWYADGTVVQKEFLPAGETMDNVYYLNVIARSCRTCHVSQRDEFSIKDLTFSNLGQNIGNPGRPSGPVQTAGPLAVAEVVCGQTDDLVRAYAMPNSRVTFDRFWLTRRGTGTPTEAGGQPADGVKGTHKVQFDQPGRVGFRIKSECINPIDPIFP